MMNLGSISDETITQTTSAQPTPLSQAVIHAWQTYISQLEGEKPTNLHALFLEQIELPLLLAVMAYTHNNQSCAAILMGLSRGTLRKKLKLYGLI